jgi:EAL domain-containing protein (putative c-di-GMP-specific phosphodiesterase class I)
MKTVIALGRELRMRVVVEGIETSDQAAVVDAARSDQVQGFFFGKPLSASEIAAGMLADFQRQVQTKPVTNGAMPDQPRATQRV